MSDTPTTGERRTIRRPGALPGGRAVLGALLVATAVVALFVGAGRAEPAERTDYVVVASPVAAGQLIAPEDLRTAPLVLSGGVAAQAFADPVALDGAVALAPLAPGDLLLRSAVRLLDAGAPQASDAVEVSLRLPAHRALDGRLQRGEVVDLVATLRAGGRSCTTVVASDATVVRTSSAADELLSARGDLTITFALPATSDVLAAVHAADEGDLTIVRSGTAIAASPRFCTGDALGGAEP